MGNKVLLIEDDLHLGELMILALERLDVKTSWFVRVRTDAADQSLVFMDADGKEVRLSDAELDFDSALIDSRLKMSQMTGPEVSKALVAKGLYVVAISGDAWLGRQMVSEGAHASIPKQDLFSRAIKEPDSVRQYLKRP